MALGRIFNVIGTKVDAYEELHISCAHISCSNIYLHFQSIFRYRYTLLAIDPRLVTRLATSDLLVSYPRDRIHFLNNDSSHLSVELPKANVENFLNTAQSKVPLHNVLSSENSSYIICINFQPNTKFWSTRTAPLTSSSLELHTC